MKKTYKPLANQNKTATSFRRKTIDPKIDLGIKKDEDGLENIDDYWRVAESILEADSVSEVDQNPPEVQNEKRFVINSLDSNVVNDEMSSSVGFSMISIEEKEEEKGNEPTFEEIKLTEANKSEDTTLYNIEEIKERLSHKTPSKIDEVDNEDIVEVEDTKSIVINTSGFDKSKPTPKAKPKPKEEKGKQEKSKEKPKQEKPKPKEKPKEKLKEEEPKNKVKRIKSLGLTAPHKPSSISEPFIIKDKEVGLSNVSASYTGKSELISLVKTGTSETAVLHLNPGAKIVKDLAYADFTLYVKKGNLDVTVQENNFVVKRDAILCIEKDVEYSLVNSGPRQVEAIITYFIE
ncbi:hypothetical protein NBO_1118g0001 [Nosema bombycis CQ1]|uniref:Uncharacterized protein n=1 Tax=Nosema bombycis (strain CQ1 / CVCC 102059) TaxID=578461 RepID=R0MFG2_NOSB1|nr:hypothetical protein NBO_1118g0001 [Nosema bombycis CQ1]|eukprot:EOB11498.1 hypothetical protein NBO_1118g0001 [Nosema bombycis CQ1]